MVAEEEGLTAEEAGRNVRYEAFRQVAEAVRADAPLCSVAIAVGQNADDQAETVLFRILRGTGTDGLAGIAYKRWDENGNAVIRPLLDCWRSEIEAYCAEHHLQPRRDHTNEETVYMRNRIRLELLPYLQNGYNPNMKAALNRLAASAEADSDFIRQAAEAAYGQALTGEQEDSTVFSLKILENFHPAIRIRLYNKALERIGRKDNISAAHLDGIEAVARSASPSASWDLPGGYLAEKRYDQLCFRRITGTEERYMLCVRVLSIGDVHEEDGKIKWKSVCLDAEELRSIYGRDAETQICLRSRKKGDFLRIRMGDGRLHRKKLQDLFVDMKIPKSMRDEIPLAAIGNEILWILPLEKSAELPENSFGLGKKGRVTSAYKVEDNSRSPIIVLEYSFQV